VLLLLGKRIVIVDLENDGCAIEIERPKIMFTVRVVCIAKIVKLSPLIRRVIPGGISSRYESIAISISMGYVLLMIRSFKGKLAEPILQDRMAPKGFPANLAKIARRKLIMVDSAAFLEALNSPPGNRLERLKGDLAGKHSIRINDQWRIVFRWTDAGPEDVEIIDYH
jgi:toxin HigB-1